MENQIDQQNPKLMLILFGAPQISLDGAPLGGLRAKSQALLFYLAVTGKSHLRATLATLFWGHLSETSARNNLRKALQHLRKALPDHLEIDKQSVGLNWDDNLWIDAVEFTRLFDQAKATGNADLLMEAVNLYQADFLAGFLVRNAEAFETWQSTHQARLREMLISALQRLSQHWLTQNDLSQAIAMTRRIIAMEPWREEVHRQLMELLARTGDRGAALAQYESCRQALADELDVEPSTVTVELMNRIRNGELDKVSSVETMATKPVQSASPHHNLPTQSTTLVGRETELADLSHIFTNPSARLITLLGPGGIGKTRLALEAADQQVAHFDDGVIFVRFAGLDSTESIIPAIAEKLSFSFYEGSPPDLQLQHYLSEKKILLILDNFEHLVDGVQVVVDLLQASTHLKILVTSRIKLNVQDEHCYSLTGIDISMPESASPVDSSLSQEDKNSVPLAQSAYGQKDLHGAYSSAVQLFVNVARRAKPDFVLTDKNVESVMHICRAVQGVPLGIILAASWIELLTPREIAVELEKSIDFLEAVMHDLPKRQQSMRAVFEQSWALLSEKEREVFQQLSIFRGGFTREAAEVVSETSLQTLVHLLHKSLLQRDSAGRFEMHELLRQYAAEKLAMHPHKQQATCDRHCAFYCDFVQQREAAINGANQHNALAEIEAELENVQLAWAWAISGCRIAEIDQAHRGLHEFYAVQSRCQEGYKDFSRAVAALHTATLSVAKSNSDYNADKLFTNLLARQGAYSVELGDYAAASSVLQQSLALANQLELRPAQSFCLKFLAEMQQHLGEQVEAEKLYRESLAISQEIGDQLEQANLSEKLGWVQTMSGQNGEAYRLFELSLTLYETVQHQYGIARLQERLAFIAWQQGKYEESERFITKSLQMFEELGSRIGVAKALGGLGLVVCAADSSKLSYAKQLLGQRLELSREIGQPLETAISLGWLAYVCIELGEYPQAQTYADELLIISKRVGHTWSISWAHCMLSEIASAQGHSQKAWSEMNEALALAKDAETHLVPLMSAIHLSFLLANECGQRNDPQSSQKSVSKPPKPQRVEQAIGLLTFVINYPAAFQIYRDKATRLREAIETYLPTDAVEAARIWGETQSLTEIVEQFVDYDHRVNTGQAETGQAEAGQVKIGQIGTTPAAVAPSVVPQFAANPADSSPLHLFGIDAARDELRAKLQSNERPWIVSIDGIGGIGKTTLAEALVETLSDTGRFNRIVWVSAKQEEFHTSIGIQPTERAALDANQLTDTLLEQLTDKNLALTQPEKEELLLRLLKADPTLVVIDNLETVTDYEALVPTLRNLADPSKFLLTSRHALTGYNDIFSLTVGELNQQDAFDLLRHEANLRGIRNMTNVSEEVLAQITEVVGGHPLALNLVIGQLSVLPLDQVLTNLKQATGERVDDFYTYIYWQAWQILNTPARQLFLAMPMLHNAVYAQLGAVTQLDADDLQSALTQLTTLSLLQVTGDLLKPRYRLHRLTETFLMNEVIKWQTQTAPNQTVDAVPSGTPEDTAEAPDQLSSQFVAGPPITQPHLFFGRNEELTRVFGWWQKVPLAHVALIGPRRCGKTSLLMHLQSIVTADPSSLRPDQEQEWLPSPEQVRWVEVDFQDPRMCKQDRLLRHLLSGFGLDAPDECSLETFMDIAYSQPWDQPTVVLMDELGAGLAAPELDQAFWWMLRALTQATDGYLAFVVAAHDQPLRLASEQGKTSPFFNVFTTVKLGPFTQPEALDLIASSPIPFAKPDIKWILEQSGRWPHLLQICCQERLRLLEAGQDSEQWKDVAQERMEPFL